MGIELPVPPDRIRSHLLGLKQKQVAANADMSVGSGNNWSVFDFCNQFLQTERCDESGEDQYTHR